jgi:hypothetical protein
MECPIPSYRKEGRALVTGAAFKMRSRQHGVRWVLSGCPHRPGEVHVTSCAGFVTACENASPSAQDPEYVPWFV